MAKFVIEGTVSEIEVSESGCFLKIKGTEGYSVKHGEKKYNVLYDESGYKKLVESESKCAKAYVLAQERFCKADGKLGYLLPCAFTGSKKVKLCIIAEEAEVLTGEAPLSVSSVTLLAE